MGSKRMKGIAIKISGALFAFLYLFIFTNGKAIGAPPSTIARGAVLMEVGSKRVLYQKNPHEKMPMASTTKIMTAIIAIERGNLDDTVTVSPNAAGVEGSSIYLRKGEQLKLRELLYGLMLRSGNDAAVAIAEHIGGSVNEFAKLMNQKAKELGAKNTSFVNPHGLHHSEHYTSAYDLALISAYAMENPTFRTIVATKYCKIPWQGNEWERILKNKNDILWSYEGGNGIKTGYTTVSRRCLASAAMRSNMQLVCIVLDCQPWFEDSMVLLDYGFKEFKPFTVFTKDQVIGEIKVKKGFEKKVAVAIKNDVVIPVKDGEASKIKTEVHIPSVLKAPIKAGTKIGNIEINLGSEVWVKEDLYTTSNIKENTFISNLKRFFDKWMTWQGLPIPGIKDVDQIG